MPILSKKATNINSSSTNGDVSVRISDATFDGNVDVSVTYPRNDLSEVALQMEALTAEPFKIGQPVHLNDDGELEIGNCLNKINIVGLALADRGQGEELPYSDVAVLDLGSAWNDLTGGSGDQLDSGRKYFLQDNGTYKKTLPTAGYILQIGNAKSNTELRVQLGNPIAL
jgi:hypothetical protein